VRYTKIFQCFFTLLLLSSCDQETNRSELNYESNFKPESEVVNYNEKLESKTGLSLPQNTRVTYFSEVVGGELYLRAKIEMSDKQFLEWIKNFNRTEKHFTTDKRYFLEPDIEDWQPSKEGQMLAEQIIFEEGKVLNIGVVNQASKQRLLYVIFHGT